MLSSKNDERDPASLQDAGPVLLSMAYRMLESRSSPEQEKTAKVNLALFTLPGMAMAMSDGKMRLSMESRHRRGSAVSGSAPGHAAA